MAIVSRQATSHTLLLGQACDQSVPAPEKAHPPSSDINTTHRGTAKGESWCEGRSSKGWFCRDDPPSSNNSESVYDLEKHDINNGIEVSVSSISRT
jgi:hypothetical protein